jgi:hypothetical protein
MDQIGVDAIFLAREIDAFLVKREKQIAETAENLYQSADVSTRIVDPHGSFARLYMKQIDESR